MSEIHAYCDCVPNLGPAHCHKCDKEWDKCEAVDAVVEARLNHEFQHVMSVFKEIIDSGISAEDFMKKFQTLKV